MALRTTRAAPGRVIHTAQALVDTVIEVPGLPARGGNVMAGDQRRHAAGAVNILLAARRQGADCLHAGAVGTGPNGDLIRDVLAAEGIGVSGEPVPDQDSGICIVMVEPGGERTFITTLGAERKLDAEMLQASHPSPGDVVCVSGYSLAVDSTRIPLLTWLALLPEGVAVVLDPGAVFEELPDDIRATMLSMTTVWTGNRDETAALLGGAADAEPSASPRGSEVSADGPLDDMARSATAAAALLGEGAVVIVRDGRHGCAVHAGGTTTVVPGFPQRAVDTNGAGDVHTGALVAARQQGLDWPGACQRANAAAAIKVTRRGPDTAPDAAETDAFLTASRSTLPPADDRTTTLG